MIGFSRGEHPHIYEEITNLVAAGGIFAHLIQQQQNAAVALVMLQNIKRQNIGLDQQASTIWSL